MTNVVEYCNKYADNIDIDMLHLDYLLNIEFPNSPFIISLGIETLKKIDQPFTNLELINIVDSRISMFNQYYMDVYPSDLYNLSNNLVVKSVDNKPITTRQILNAMIIDNHYNNQTVCKDYHRFLKSFYIEDRPDTFCAVFCS
jgi:hypothetical protein